VLYIRVTFQVQPRDAIRHRSLLSQVSFVGLFCRSLSLVSFVGLLCRFFLQVSFVTANVHLKLHVYPRDAISHRSLLQVSIAGLFWNSTHLVLFGRSLL